MSDKTADELFRIVVNGNRVEYLSQVGRFGSMVRDGNRPYVATTLEAQNALVELRDRATEAPHE